MSSTRSVLECLEQKLENINREDTATLNGRKYRLDEMKSDKGKRSVVPAGPYENLASNRVLNLIKTRNSPPGVVATGVVQRDTEERRPRVKERRSVGSRGALGGDRLQGCHPNYLWLDKKKEEKKKKRIKEKNEVGPRVDCS